MSDQNEPLKPRFSIKKARINNSEPAGKKSDRIDDESPNKIIYIEIDEEITSVFDKIKRVKSENAALVVPRRAILLQSIVNLKILKKKIDELGKKITIITSDIQGLALAEKAGIQATSKLLNQQTRAEDQSPVKQSVIIRNERPTKVSGKKLSIAEIIRKDRPTLFNSLISRIKEYWKKRKASARETKFVIVTPNKQALFTLILVSVLLLLAIAYIALPGATIYITPKSSITEASFNINFLDFEKNKTTLENPYSNALSIATFPVNPPPFTKKITHNATGKLFRGENARGIITVINLSNNPWDLVAKTRFQTEDGLIFRLISNVRVPAAKDNSPGTLNVEVIADEFDTNGQAIGGRGNIPPSKFFLPGLKNEENKKKLSGESKMPMVGGVTKIIKTISKEDIEAAINKTKTNVIKEAADDLKKYLEEQNLANRSNFSLLTDKHAIIINEPKLNAPNDLIGKEAEQFEIAATYETKGISFDRQTLNDLLKTNVTNRVDPDKTIVKINENDLSYKFLDGDISSGKIRLTVIIRAIQIYELDPEKENGVRFIKKITDHIVGLRLKDAEDYLQQQTKEISKVEIKLWPVWAPTIPNIADNIKFVVKEEAAY